MCYGHRGGWDSEVAPSCSPWSVGHVGVLLPAVGFCFREVTISGLHIHQRGESLASCDLIRQVLAGGNGSSFRSERREEGRASPAALEEAHSRAVHCPRRGPCGGTPRVASRAHGGYSMAASKKRGLESLLQKARWFQQSVSGSEVRPQPHSVLISA